MCDIEQMFHRFRISVTDRNYLRFLWFEDSSMQRVREYTMAVHLFGATSSLGCATYGLRKVAKDHCKNPMALRFIPEDFYIDDGLLSLPREQEACTMIADTREA